MHRDRHEIPTFDWSARLELAYVLRDGRTVPVHRRHVGPLRVQKHFHPEPSGACHQIVVHPPGGVAGGDALSLDVSLEAGAHAPVTSPGAAKWWHGHGREAVQESARGRLVSRGAGIVVAGAGVALALGLR